jgi:hypothetical protein
MCADKSTPGRCVPEYECNGNVLYKSSDGVRLCPAPTVCCVPPDHLDGAQCKGAGSGKPGTCRRRYIKTATTGALDKNVH